MANAPVIDEVELDRLICREATGGPGGQTTVIKGGNAKEKRNIDFPDSVSEWQIMWVAHAQEAKFTNLVSFFRARRMRGYGFRFFDWTDHDDWGMGVVKLDANIGKYRLYKEYDDDIRPALKPIYKPISGTVELAGVDDATADDIDYTTGIIEGATSEGTWTGQFNLPVRFDSDKMRFRVTPDLNVIWEGIPVIELI